MEREEEEEEERGEGRSVQLVGGREKEWRGGRIASFSTALFLVICSSSRSFSLSVSAILFFLHCRSCALFSVCLSISRWFFLFIVVDHGDSLYFSLLFLSYPFFFPRHLFVISSIFSLLNCLSPVFTHSVFHFVAFFFPCLPFDVSAWCASKMEHIAFLFSILSTCALLYCPAKIKMEKGARRARTLKCSP